MKVLFDTCLNLELIAKQPNPKVVEFVNSLEADDIYLSIITVGEIIKGIEKLPELKRKQELHTWLKEDLLTRFQGKIIPLDIDVVMNWGRLAARLELTGKIMPAIDALIAATVLTHELQLATRNIKDFEATGVDMINPWE